MTRLIYVNSEPNTDVVEPSLYEIGMALFQFPKEAALGSPSFYSVENSDYGFPLRCRFLNPVVNPAHPTYRLCPNFPEIYIDQQGNILEEDLLTWFSLVPTPRKPNPASYVVTRVPGSHYSKPVSVFRLYADAWGPDTFLRTTNHYPIPRNGNWQDYCPKNVKWAPRFYSERAFLTNLQEMDVFGISQWHSLTHPDITDWLDTQYPQDDTPWYDCGLGTSSTFGCVVRNAHGNSIDWCYYTHFYLIFSDQLDLVDPEEPQTRVITQSAPQHPRQIERAGLSGKFPAFSKNAPAPRPRIHVATSFKDAIALLEKIGTYTSRNQLRPILSQDIYPCFIG